MNGILFFGLFVSGIFIFYMIIEAAVRNGVVSALRNYESEKEKTNDE